jgi:hypothetical protein
MLVPAAAALADRRSGAAGHPRPIFVLQNSLTARVWQDKHTAIDFRSVAAAIDHFFWRWKPEAAR